MTKRIGLDGRTPAQRRRDWQREMDALTPAERAVWDLLPYSEIPYPGQARDIVAAVRAPIAGELADLLDTMTPASPTERSGMEAAVSILARWADDGVPALKQEADRD